MTMKEKCERCGKAVELADCKKVYANRIGYYVCPQCFADYEAGKWKVETEPSAVLVKDGKIINTKEAFQWIPIPDEIAEHAERCRQILSLYHSHSAGDMLNDIEAGFLVPECDNAECHAEDKPKSPVCGFCEKPITGEPAMRHNMLPGITTFFHADCVERVDELTAEIKPELHTFESGAVRYPTGTRWDLMSPIAFRFCVPHRPTCALIWYLLSLDRKPADNDKTCYVLYELLEDALAIDKTEILRLYAESLDEGAKKYGDRNWEKGIPENNLVSHAICHAVMLANGDTRENHASHLVWNVFSIIHFRMKEKIDAILQVSTENPPIYEV